MERTLKIEAPPAVAAGSEFAVVISATTDAAAGERVGFLQVDVSVDDGHTWAPQCYLDNDGVSVRREFRLTAGNAGTVIRVRARVAFRDGLAGDVDYTGAAIRWHDNWAAWDEPPARIVVISVRPSERSS
ncbi:MAG: hypothetical protein IT582_09340 [Opitutaceae bacterium]|nr:hypothetical protein [Opitutaceae bacterium]